MKMKTLLAILLVLSSSTAALAGPAAPRQFVIRESDGTSFTARMHGDEFQNWVEATGSGHTVVRNEKAKRWEYAEKRPDGKLAPSGIKVDPSGRFAPEFIKKGIVPPRDVEREKRHNDALKQMLEKRKAASPLRHGRSGHALGAAASYAPGDWAPQPVSGEKKVLIVLVSFADRDIRTLPSAWSDMVFDTTRPSVAKFYQDNSFGKLSIVPVPHSQSGNPAGVVSVKLTSSSSAAESTWVAEAINKIAASPINVDFTALDLDGDGIIDREEALLYFVAAGYEQSSGTSYTPHVWAHATIYPSGGLVAAGKTFPVYAMNGELNGAGHQMTMGVITHELGHQLCGLPDLYDTTYYNAGLGDFSVMAGGSWGYVGNGDDIGARPVSDDAWSREYLGWTSPVTPTANGAVSLDAALGSADNALKLLNPSYNSTEYWLAENRYPTPGSWDEGLRGLIGNYAGGMLITHVDITVGTQGSNDINRHGVAAHQGLVPAQASTSPCDMLASGSANSCRGTSRTTFSSGTNANFSTATTPSSTYYSGVASSRGINNISAAGPTMTASVTVTETPDILKPSVTAFSIPAVSTSFTIPVYTFSATDNVGVTGYLITETSTTPLSGDSRWSATPAGSWTFASSGTKTLYAWAKDSAGNISPAKTATVAIDQSAPVVTSFVLPANYNALTVPVILSVTDNVAVAGYQLTETATAPAVSDSNWQSGKPASYTFGSLGPKTLYAWAKDSAGNVSLSKSATVFLETTAPTVDSFSVDPLVAGLIIPVRSFSGSDDANGSGIGGYMVTETATAPLASATKWTAVAPTTYTTSAGGSKTLYAWVKDKAGNVSQARSATLFVDASKPVVSVFTVPAASTSFTIAITALSATDNVAVDSYMVTESSAAPTPADSRWNATPPTGWTFATTGMKTLYAWAKDTAGNVSAGKSAMVAVDQTAPLVTAFAIPAAYNSLTVPVTTLAASDNVAIAAYQLTESPSAPSSSDINWKSSKPASYTFGAIGLKSLYAWAKDTAGNVSLSRTASVLVETTPPTVDSFGVDALVAGLVIPVRAFTASDDIGGSGIGGYMITETATPPAASANKWTVTAPSSYTTSAGGTKTLYAWAKDKAGNVSQGRSATLFVDASKPVVSTFAIPSASSNFTIAINSFIATDNVAVASYMITETSTIPAASDSRWSVTAPTSWTFATAGVKTLYAWAKDTAGNVSAAKSATVAIDQTAPSITVFAIPANFNALTVPVTTLTVSDNVAVAAYQLTETATAPDASDINWKSAKPASYTFGSLGVKTLYAWAKDSAGNVSASRSATVFLETTAPTVDSFSVDSLVAGLTIPVRAFTGSDDANGSGIGGYMVTETATAPLASATKWTATAPASYTTSAGGTKTLYAWVRDKAGNISQGRSATLLVDASKPVVSVFTIPAASASFTIPITAVSATDNVAVASYMVTDSSSAPLPSDQRWSGTPPTNWTFATTGTKTLYAWAMDTAGNVSSAKSATVAIDQSAPTVSSFVLPANYNSVTVPVSTLTASDNVAVQAYQLTESSTAPDGTDPNWKSTKPASYTFNSLGPKTLYAWAKDSAGNVSASRSATVFLENTAPTVGTFSVDSLVAGLTIPVRAFTGSDDVNGSGIGGYMVTETAIAPLASASKWTATAPTSYTTSAGGAKTLYAWVKDRAGNVSQGSGATLYVDASKPVVLSFSIPTTYYGLTVPILGFSASDNVGIASCMVTDSSTTPAPTDSRWSATPPVSWTFASTGTKTLYAWVKDTAGNVSAARSATVVLQ